MADQDEGNSFFRWLVALGLPLLLLALFVIHQQTKTPPLSQPSTTATRSLDDSGIATTVQDAIHDNSSLSDQAKTVTVENVGGTVTLRGTVSSPEEKTLIEQIAKNTNGVNQVKNEIEVR